MSFIVILRVILLFGSLFLLKLLSGNFVYGSSGLNGIVAILFLIKYSSSSDNNIYICRNIPSHCDQLKVLFTMKRPFKNLLQNFLNVLNFDEFHYIVILNFFRNKFISDVAIKELQALYGMHSGLWTFSTNRYARGLAISKNGNMSLLNGCWNFPHVGVRFWLWHAYSVLRFS